MLCIATPYELELQAALTCPGVQLAPNQYTVQLVLQLC